MRTIQKHFEIATVGVAVLLMSGLSNPAAAQSAASIAAGRTVLTFVNRLLVNPPQQVLAFGYFPSIEGLPAPLFSGTPGENTAYFTWSLEATGATQIQNGDANAPGGIGVAVLPSGESFHIYYNANPNQNWNNPGSFSAGQLIATLQSSAGTQTASGSVAFVTQSYVLMSSEPFSFKGQTHDFSRLIPHGFTLLALSGNVPLGGATMPPLTFAAAGSGVAIGGALSGLPRWF